MLSNIECDDTKGEKLMHTVLRIFGRVMLVPVWIILGTVQAIGTIVVGMGNTLFYVLSGLCFLTAIACVGLLGETIADQRVIFTGGCVFGLLPFFMTGMVAVVTFAKLLVGAMIFE